MQPNLDIELVICTHNNAAQLTLVLDAIAQQQVSDSTQWGVLVVNNNCTDGTADLVEQAIATGKIPLLHMVQETTQGLTSTRPCGMTQRTAPWIAYVDNDYVLQPDGGEQTVRFVTQHPEARAFGGGRVVLTWETTPSPFVLGYGYCFAEQEHGMQIQEQRDCLVVAGMVVNRKALDVCGWTKRQLMHDRIGEKLISGGDFEMALRIRGAGYFLWYTPACVLKHLIPPRRTSPTYLKSMNMGLGTCQIYADLMLWAGSFSAWVQSAAWKTTKLSLEILSQTLRMWLGRVEPVDVAIQWSFVKGRWVGLVQLLQTDQERQQSLMGCAKL
ncbi:glycosyltransferase family 2 protein [Pseudanabaena biceps]|nr:glycosyltransferase family 2 protein [Pseudanabaena biceps]